MGAGDISCELFPPLPSAPMVRGNSYDEARKNIRIPCTNHWGRDDGGGGHFVRTFPSAPLGPNGGGEFVRRGEAKKSAYLAPTIGAAMMGAGDISCELFPPLPSVPMVGGGEFVRRGEAKHQHILHQPL